MKKLLKMENFSSCVVRLGITKDTVNVFLLSGNNDYNG
jgi:hypothetical protein